MVGGWWVYILQLRGFRVAVGARGRDACIRGTVHLPAQLRCDRFHVARAVTQPLLLPLLLPLPLSLLLPLPLSFLLPLPLPRPAKKEHSF
jgi:hypothetical protein